MQEEDLDLVNQTKRSSRRELHVLIFEQNGLLFRTHPLYRRKWREYV